MIFEFLNSSIVMMNMLHSMINCLLLNSEVHGLYLLASYTAFLLQMETKVYHIEGPGSLMTSN